MIQLLIIADDFIGTLDTGIQFAACGAPAQVTTDVKFDFKKAPAGVRVLVMDAETRSLPAEKAYRVVAGAVRRAQKAGVPYIYKKTDSTLRGNVGAELSALCEASGSTRVHFIPAYPQIGRVTRGGVHYINEVPIHESTYGQDPAFKGDGSSVVDLVKKQSNVPVHHMGGAVSNTPKMPDGILVYDSETETQMEQIAYGLARRGELSFCAGCAGFAAALPRLLGLIGPRPAMPALRKNLLVVCGSANPVAKAQMEAAEQAGMAHVRLDCSQKLAPAWASSTEAAPVLDQWKALCEEKGALILDSNEAEGGTCEAEYARTHGLSAEQMRANVSASMGGVIRQLLNRGLDATLLVVGGGTMLQFMQQAQLTELSPKRDLAPGTVMTTLQYNDKTVNCIIKPGMFGSESLICDMHQLVQENAK